MPLQFVAQGPMLIPVASYVGPGDLSGLTAGYTGWWGVRAYSAAKAAALANALELRSLTSGLNATIHLTAAGVLNAADIATLDGTTGYCVNVIYDQVGSANWLATGGNATRPIFHKDFYGTNKHALEWTSNTNIENATNFPNTANNYIWTSHLKFVTGQGAQTVIWGSNATANFFCGMDATNIFISQDPAFGRTNLAIAPGLDVAAAVLWHFNGTTGSAIAKDGTDNTLGTTVGTVGITDNRAGLGDYIAGGGFGWTNGFWSEGGFMSNTATSANSINSTKRSAITTEMKSFYT